MTGLTYFASEQATKRLEIMRDLIPAIRRVALLINPENPLVGLELDASESAARHLNMTVRPFEVRSRAELEGAFSMMTKGGFEGVVVAQDGILSGSASAIAAIALRERLPSVGDSAFANDGGLVSFGPNSSEMFRRAAYFVNRLLKGTKASELPVERPTKFEMTINLKTAKALGLDMPTSVLLRADEVIE